MLEVELDIFSGMPNPTWTLTYEEEGELTERIRAVPQQVSPLHTSGEAFGLGYRGFIVRLIKDDNGPWSRYQSSRETPFPIEFRVGSVPTDAGSSVAEWLLETSARRVGVDDELLSSASRGVNLIPPPPEDPPPPPQSGGSRPGKQEQSFEGIRGVWLDPCPDANSLYWDNYATFNGPDVVGKNNCYCFAANHIANRRYALPGLRGGAPAQSMSVGQIASGLDADGWRETCQQPDGLTIAGAVWPGQDYHFYRLVTNGDEWLWAHKQGGTPVIHEDRSGRTLKRIQTGPYTDIWWHPEVCDRGDYTAFVGFFYQENATALVK
ncbi:hypothetical protein [Nonomuraea sp. NPDC049684]|uniref:hypothetical protein n=1 Tax=Nonomuraea sp. NPDC049684 TaxID=3364356 RepID=UPI0037A37D02